VRILNKYIAGAKVAVVTGCPTVEDEASGLLFRDKMTSTMIQKMVGYGVPKYSRLAVSHIRYHEYRQKGTVWNYIPLSPEESLCYRELLKRELEKGDYNIIVALGETAWRALTPFQDINRYRGSVVPSNLVDCKVLGMVEPNRSMRDPKLLPLQDWDLQKLMYHKGTKDLLRKKLDIIITQDLDLLAKEFLDPEYLADPNSMLAFDIETTSTHEMSCIGFAKDANTAYVIPLYHVLSNKLPQTIKLIDAIMRSPVKKIAQNGNFDCMFMGYYYGIKVENFYWDTMLCQHSMFPNLSKGLDVLASIYTNEPYWKDEGKSWKNQWKFNEADWQQFYEYNGKDAANTFEIAESQPPLLAARGTEEIFRREMRLCYPLIHAEVKGMKVDPGVKKKLQDDNDICIAKAELFLHNLVDGDEGYTTSQQFLDMLYARRAKKALEKVYKDPRNGYLNINSPKQVKAYLYDKCKLPKRVKKGKVVTDEDALLSLQKYGFELVSVILYLRKIKKRDTFYSIKIDSDGRVRTTFKPGGTETGRLSSSKSITGTGFNLQTIPKEMRIFFIADDGYILLAPDYAKAESWIVAYLAGDTNMLEALRGEDFHSTNASAILGRKVTKADYIERQLGKKISHAANYRTTAFTLEKELAKEGFIFSKRECQNMLTDYFRNYPKVKIYQEKIIRELSANNKTIKSPFGRVITYYKFWGNDLFNAACAFKPQSCVGDMTNEALINIYYNIKPEVRLDILLQVHDQLVMQVHKDDLTWDLIKKIEKEMSIEITIGLDTFTIPVDMSIGHNWYELDELSCEEDYDKWREDNI
jgi:DNA polymerase I-like protein with 3'-5' exonuclease and polymerase domains/uracil-DNA glycosylase